MRHPLCSRGLVAMMLTGISVSGQASDDYNAATAAYKKEISRDDPTLINSSFISDLAVSRAMRSVNQQSAMNNDNAENTAGSPSSGDITSSGDVNVASPQIFGTVRGDVNIVTSPRARRGSITSVTR